MNRLFFSALALAAFCSISRANLQFDPERNCIWVTDFPADYPCDPARIAAIDKINGWGKIFHDQASDTWTINASLWIGTDDGTDTYFQLGDPDHPKPTLILNGNLVVCPSDPAEKKARTATRHINRFTMGNATNSGITATLKIRGDPTNGNSIFVGVIPPYKNKEATQPERWDCYSGQFHMFNGRVTAVVEDEAHRIGAKIGWGCVFMKGDSIYLIHSTIAWAKAVTGLHAAFDHAVEDTVFDHCGTAVAGYYDTKGYKPIRGCTFKNGGTGLSNPLRGTVLINCTFMSNDCNWNSSSELGTLSLVDCAFDVPRKGNIYKFNADLVKRGYAGDVIATRHVVIAVNDADGKPVNGALVGVQCEQTGAKEQIVTGADGKTPGRESENAMIMTEMMAKTIAGTEAGAIRSFTYTLSAAADGYEPSVLTNVCPRTSWQTIGLTLRKKQ